jgi:hypothetical protein
MYASNFAPADVRTVYRSSFAVRARPGAALSRAAVGPYNRGMHAEMLAAYGREINAARFDSAAGSTYLDLYRLLLGRASAAGLSLPPLIVAGHAVPDLRLDETPSIRVIGEFDGPVSTFAVIEETSLCALLSFQSATAAARSQRFDAFAVVLADRAELAYCPTDPERQPTDDRAIMVRFDVVDTPGGEPHRRVAWRSGLVTAHDIAAAASDLAAEARGPVVIPADLADYWTAPGVQVALASQPATGLLDIALDQPAGSETLLIGFDPDRRQLAALSFQVPAVSL